MTRQPAEKMRLDVVDGLRGIAVLLVAWYHFWQITWTSNFVRVGDYTMNFEFLPITGFVGVDLFFFLSGFCLMLPYAKSVITGAPPPTAKEFYFRRAVKILPSLWVSLAIMIPLFGSYSNSTAQFWQRLAAHLFFVNNFDPGTMGSINGVLWSLAVEVQFYALFPWICRAFLRRPWPVFALVTTVAWASRLWIAFGPADQMDFRLSQLPAVLDLFMAGMMASYLYAKHGRRIAAAPNATWIATVAAFAAGALFVHQLYLGYLLRYDHDPYAKWHIQLRFTMCVLFPVFTVASLIASDHWKRAVARPSLLFLSTLSYNLYIWHQPLGRYLTNLGIPAPRTPNAHDDPAWALPAFVLMCSVAIGVSTFLTFALERPILDWGTAFCARHFKRRAPVRRIVRRIARRRVSAPKKRAA